MTLPFQDASLDMRRFADDTPPMPLTLLASLPLLDPRALNAQADAAVRGLMREGSSANTAASYRAAIRYWTAWFELRYGQPFTLPLPEAAVIQFVVDHAQRLTDHGLTWELPLALDQELVRLKAKGKLGPPSLNTLLQRLSVLSKAHELLGHPNPCRAAPVRELLAKTRRAYARRGMAPAKKEALTREPLQAMLATCDDTLRGVRDRALLLFAWASGGRRRSIVPRPRQAAVAPQLDDGGLVGRMVGPDGECVIGHASFL